MLVHIVLFKFNAGIGWGDPRVLAAEDTTRNHPRHIPEIRHWTVGRNVTDREVAYDFAVIGRFADRAALDRYLIHPDHQRGVAAWRELSTWVVADLEADPDADPDAAGDTTAVPAFSAGNAE